MTPCIWVMLSKSRRNITERQAVTQLATRTSRIRAPSRWRRAIQWPLQRVMVAMSRFDLFLVRGLEDGLDSGRFLRARYFRIASDYVRNAVVELICREINQNGIAGDVAELGVYEGDFAA